MLHLLFSDWCHALAFLQVDGKRSPSPDLTWTNETFPASQYKMLPFRSIRRRLQTKGLSRFHLFQHMAPLLGSHSIKWLGLLGRCVLDSTNRLDTVCSMLPPICVNWAGLKRSFISQDCKELLTLLLTRAQCQLTSGDSSIFLMRRLTPTYASQGFAYAHVLMTTSPLTTWRGV